MTRMNKIESRNLTLDNLEFKDEIKTKNYWKLSLENTGIKLERMTQKLVSDPTQEYLERKKPDASVQCSN